MHGSAPFRHWGISTFIAALKHDRIDAPWVLDGPVNGDAFWIHVETQLVPTLNRGDIVIMDNQGSHKTEAGRAVVRGTGPSSFPSALQPRSQPDQAGVRQGQALPEEGLAAKSGRPLEDRRLHPEKVHTRRMLERDLTNSGYQVGQTK